MIYVKHINELLYQIISVNILLITVNTLPIYFSAFSTRKLFLQNSFDKVKKFYKNILPKLFFTENYFTKKLFLQKIIFTENYFTEKFLFLSHHTLHCHKFITIHYIILCWSTTTYSICTNIINEVFNV